MRLRVTDLGPVREAEIDLSKPLLILTGPNNSGKTYLSWVIYSLARTDIGRVRCPASVLEVAKELLRSPDQSVSYEVIFATSQDFVQSIADTTRERLANDFGAPADRFLNTKLEVQPTGDLNVESTRLKPGSLTHASMPFTWVSLENGGQLALTSLNRRLQVTMYLHAHNGHLGNDPSRNHTFKSMDFPFTELDDAKKATVEAKAARMLMLWLRSRLFEAAVPFPVERLAISLFARELAANRTELIDELISERPEANLREHLQQRAGLYPLVIRDALQDAIRASLTKTSGPYADLADELETAILGGHIKFNDQGDLEFTPTQISSGSPLRLHESASVVKSLGSLVVHLRYHAWTHQRLFIDEPELNLHPDSQRRIARILAKAVNRGLKLLISTHSDYIIRELNNLIMLGQDTDEAKALIEDLGYDPEAVLTGEQMGVYLVNEGACRNIPVDETGFEIATIDQVASDLNRDTQEIFSRLFGD
jgi:predicted ATP-binding protein involved in virulence